MAETGEFEFQVKPKTEYYRADDDRWRVEVSQLIDGLDQEVGGVRQEQNPVAGKKGGLESVIVALGSAGAFTAAVEYFRAWLGRDRTRSMEITWMVNGQEQRVTIRGEAIDQSALRDLAGAAAMQIGGVQWPRGATEPS